ARWRKGGEPVLAAGQVDIQVVVKPQVGRSKYRVDGPFREVFRKGLAAAVADEILKRHVEVSAAERDAARLVVHLVAAHHGVDREATERFVEADHQLRI